MKKVVGHHCTHKAARQEVEKRIRTFDIRTVVSDCLFIRISPSHRATQIRSAEMQYLKYLVDVEAEAMYKETFCHRRVCQKWHQQLYYPPYNQSHHHCIYIFRTTTYQRQQSQPYLSLHITPMDPGTTLHCRFSNRTDSTNYDRINQKHCPHLQRLFLISLLFSERYYDHSSIQSRQILHLPDLVLLLRVSQMKDLCLLVV